MAGKHWEGEPIRHQNFYAKLAKRYYGPFQIWERINEAFYRLELPSPWHIHNAFHVSLLKLFKGDPPLGPIKEDPLEFEEQEEILQPKKILKHEENVLCNGRTLRQYLVKFKNYPLEDAKWMQDRQLGDSLDVLNEYKFLYGLDNE